MPIFFIGTVCTENSFSSHKSHGSNTKHVIYHEMASSSSSATRGFFRGRLTQGVSNEQRLNGEGFTPRELSFVNARNVPAYLEHNYNNGIAGTLTGARYDSRDNWLYVTGFVNTDTPLGSNVYKDLRSGKLKGLSAGFAHPPVGTCKSDSEYFNRLLEVSFVQNPHVPGAQVLQCHSKDSAGKDIVISTVSGDASSLQWFDHDPDDSDNEMADTAAQTPAPSAAATSSGGGGGDTPKLQTGPDGQPTLSSVRRAAVSMGIPANQVNDVSELIAGQVNIEDPEQVRKMLTDPKFREQAIMAQLKHIQALRSENERMKADNQRLSETVALVDKEYAEKAQGQVEQLRDFASGSQEFSAREMQVLNAGLGALGSKKDGEVMMRLFNSLMKRNNEYKDQLAKLQEASTSMAYGNHLAAQQLGGWSASNHPATAAASSSPAQQPMAVTQHTAGAPTTLSATGQLPHTSHADAMLAANDFFNAGLMGMLQEYRKRSYAEQPAAPAVPTRSSDRERDRDPRDVPAQSPAPQRKAPRQFLYHDDDSVPAGVTLYR